MKTDSIVSWLLGFTASWAAACGTDGAERPGPDPDPDPVGLSSFERCVADGGTVAEQWSTENFHGAVTSIGVTGSTVVLASEDGSVKQWQIGESPSYGTTFSQEGGAAVGALAFSSDGHVLGVDGLGQLSEWRLSDARPMRTTPIGEVALVAVAVSDDAELAIVTSDPPNLRAVDRSAQTISPPLPTELWGVSSIRFSRDVLLTAGHWYGNPMIERRLASDPAEVVDTWHDQTTIAVVRAVALTPDATTVIAAGDGFVAVFDATALEAGPVAITTRETHRAIGIVLLPGGELFATAGAEGTIEIWRAADASHVTTVEIAAPAGIGVDRAGDQLFTSGADGILRSVGCRP